MKILFFTISFSDLNAADLFVTTMMQETLRDSRQPARTYSDSGVPPKCPDDSYLVHGGLFMLLEIERLKEANKIAFTMDLNMSRQVHFNKKESRVIGAAAKVMTSCAF